MTTTDRNQTHFVFKNLPPDQTYRFMARAYDEQDQQISEDEASVTDVRFERIENMGVKTLTLKLKDTPFAGTARATVRFHEDKKGETQRVLITLYKKKGSSKVQVGSPLELSTYEIGSGKAIHLNGLAPNTDYLLEARAYEADGKSELAYGSVEWSVTGTQQERGDKDLVISFPIKVSTYAGSSTGHEDGPLDAAKFKTPRALALGLDGAIYVTDESDRHIRKIANGQVTTFVGNGSNVESLGTGTDANIPSPTGIACHPTTGELYVGNSYGKIYRVTPDGVVSVFAEGMGTIYHLCVDASGNVFGASYSQNKIFKVTPEGG